MVKTEKVNMWFTGLAILFTLSIVTGNEAGIYILENKKFNRLAKEVNEITGENFTSVDISNDQVMLDYINGLENTELIEDVVDLLSKKEDSIFNVQSSIQDNLREDLKIVKTETKVFNKKLLINIILLSFLVACMNILGGNAISVISFIVIILIYAILKMF